jgi:hypothetical protein
MRIRVGLIVSFLIVAFEWCVLIGFVEHAFLWWLKASEPVVTAGIAGTVVFTLGSLLAVGFSWWAYERQHKHKSWLQYVAKLLALAGLSGLGIFFGMVFFGYVVLVHR